MKLKEGNEESEEVEEKDEGEIEEKKNGEMGYERKEDVEER